MRSRKFTAVGNLAIGLILICAAATFGACSEVDPVTAPSGPETYILVDVTPDSTLFEWTLSGPDAFFCAGQADRLLSGLTPGDYELTWMSADGYDGPDPAKESRSVTEGDTVTFHGSYSLQSPLIETYEILFLGSSYFARNDLPGLFRQIATAQGINVVIDSIIPNGIYLDTHASSAATEAKIDSREWDYVILQGVGRVVAYPSSSHFKVLTALKTLEEKIHGNCADTIVMFCMPWAFEDGMTWTPGGTDTYFDMQQHIYDNTLQYAEEVDMVISPVGWAFNEIMLRDDTPLHYLYVGDFNHPSLKGSYLMACTIYSSVYLQAMENTIQVGKITEAEATLFQDTAASIVLSDLLLWGLE